MTSQGQRFRRRALRRGYKVDEVDAFLDRVEATIAGEPIDTPVTAQEVHDVVFRVRFGGYDEWQVDLHLDRVERQLAEAQAQASQASQAPPAPPASVPEPRAPHYPPERMGLPPSPAAAGPGYGPGGPGPAPAPAPGPGGPGYGPRPGPGPMPGPGQVPGPAGSPMSAPAGPPPAPPYRDPGYDRYDEPTYGGFDAGEPARPGMPGGGADRFATDVTSEMRLGDPGGPPPPPAPRAPEPPRPGFGGPPAISGPPPMAGPGTPPPGMGPRGVSGPPAPMGSPPEPGYGPPMGGAEGPHGELARLDQLRRSFQPRRFGSGYDRDQVDRLFDQVMAAVSGRGPVTVSEADLDPKRFDLVPGGYFEAEVEQALDEVRDILRRL